MEKEIRRIWKNIRAIQDALLSSIELADKNVKQIKELQRQIQLTQAALIQSNRRILTLEERIADIEKAIYYEFDDEGNLIEPTQEELNQIQYQEPQPIKQEDFRKWLKKNGMRWHDD